MFCRKCGAELRDDDIFCSKCGVCVDSAQNDVENMHDETDSVLDLSQINNEITPRKGKNKKLIIALSVCACVVVIAAVIAAVFIFGGNTGDKYFAQGKYEEAADEYEDMLEHDFKNTAVRIKLAKAEMELREYNDVIETLDSVLKYEDGNSEVFELLITACAKEGEDDLANEYYREAQEKNISFNLKDTGYGAVPDLIDLSFDTAQKSKDIIVIEQDRIDDEAKEGTIIKQYPEADTIAESEAGIIRVYVTVSGGPGQAVMKNYQGSSFADVKADLGEDYTVEKEEEGSSSVEKGKVIRTVPAAGETLKKGDNITVFVSSGERIVSVPKITGKTLDQSEDILDNVDLKIGNVTYESSTKEEETIITQTPAYKTKVNADTYVDVVVSSGE